jgi:hypothetical protein
MSSTWLLLLTGAALGMAVTLAGTAWYLRRKREQEVQSSAFAKSFRVLGSYSQPVLPAAENLYQSGAPESRSYRSGAPENRSAGARLAGG